MKTFIDTIKRVLKYSRYDSGILTDHGERELSTPESINRLHNSIKGQLVRNHHYNLFYEDDPKSFVKPYWYVNAYGEDKPGLHPVEAGLIEHAANTLGEERLKEDLTPLKEEHHINKTVNNFFPPHGPRQARFKDFINHYFESDKYKSKALKYSHDNFHAILKTMTHNDWAGNKHADNTKRLVLADAYKEATGDEEGAERLRSQLPAIYHEGKIVPARLAMYAKVNGNTHRQWNHTPPIPYVGLNLAKDKLTGFRTLYHEGVMLDDFPDDIRDEDDPSLIYSKLHPTEYGTGWSVRKELLLPENHEAFNSNYINIEPNTEKIRKC